MSFDNIWPWISNICVQTNSFLHTKMGIDFNLSAKCEQTRTLVINNLNLILIVSGVLLILASITGILRRLNDKTKKFNAKLLHKKEISHDTKIFTFDLPKGWKRIGLNIGEHITLTYCCNNKEPR